MNSPQSIPTKGEALPVRSSHRDVLIGIPTFNRKQVVEMAAYSVSKADELNSANILVIDDASSDYDLDHLRTLYPADTFFIRNTAPSGMASHVARQLMRSFLEGTESTLIILDSDLVVAKDFLSQARAMLARTDGLLSLFHAHSHPWTERDGLLLKHSVGFAGSVWTRPLVQEILQKVVFTPHFDDGICDFLRKNNRKICSLKNSAVQHIGLVEGANASFATADFGLSFSDTSWYNLAAIQSMVVQGCQLEFQKSERRHYVALAEMREAIQALRSEVTLLRSGFALGQGEDDRPVDQGLSWRKRISAELARIAFRLLHFSLRDNRESLKTATPSTNRRHHFELIARNSNHDNL